MSEKPREYINATEAFELWQEKGYVCSYPTFLTLMKKQDFVYQPASRVILIDKLEFKEFIRKYNKEAKNAS
jgi:hypothetical protein